MFFHCKFPPSHISREHLGIWDVAKGEGKTGGSLIYGLSGICPWDLKSLLCLSSWCINGFLGHTYCQRRGGGITSSV